MRQTGANLSLGLLLSLLVVTNGTRNLTNFPACVSDIDCQPVSLQRSADFKCFQFMCFPWNEPALQAPYTTCQRTSDCNSPELECFRHQDRRNVLQGLCLHSSHLLTCFSHSDCPDDLQCVVGWCAPARYLDAIAELGCDSDGLCEDLLLGDACCYDLRGAVLPEGSWPGGEKRCCKEEVYPVIPPVQGLNRQQINRLNKKINDLFAPFGLDQLICEGVEPALMEELEACQEFITLPVPTSTRPTETRAPHQQNPPRNPSGTRSPPRGPPTPRATRPSISGCPRRGGSIGISAILIFLISKQTFVL